MRPAPDSHPPTHPTQSGAGSIVHRDCTAMRHIRRSHHKMNVLTGAMTTTAVEDVVEPCGAPLFTDAERTAGTCRHCAQGWEAEGNRFATPAEIAAYTRGLALETRVAECG